MWLLDPASTGGLVDAIERGDIPGPAKVSKTLDKALRIFRDPDGCLKR
jgi:hypothetical protein